MSDWDDADMYDDEEDEEELSFEDTDEELGEANDVQDDNAELDGSDNKLQNFDFEGQYFWGKELKEDDKLLEAINIFKKIIEFHNDNDIEKDDKLKPVNNNNKNKNKDEYIFKSIKQCMKCYFELKNYDQILELLDLFFKQLPLVNLSYGETSFTKLVNKYDRDNNSEFLNKFYDRIINYLEIINSNNNKLENYNSNIKSYSTMKFERVWLRCNLRKTNLLIENKNYNESLRILNILEKNCEFSTESIKTTFLIEIISNKIIISMANGFNIKELKYLSDKAKKLMYGVPHSRIIGIVKECMGLVNMYYNDYLNASINFNESFKNFNESGDERRIEVLSKLIISNILCESKINPFKLNEFQIFLKNNLKIQKLMILYNSIQDLNLKKFNNLIKRDEIFKKILNDDYFLNKYLKNFEELLISKFLINYFKNFKFVSLNYLSIKLEMSTDELEDLLIKLINKGDLINIKLDLVNELVIINDFKNNNNYNYNSTMWSKTFNTIEFLNNLNSINNNYKNNNNNNNENCNSASTENSGSSTSTTTINTNNNFNINSNYNINKDNVENSSDISISTTGINNTNGNSTTTGNLNSNNNYTFKNVTSMINNGNGILLDTDFFNIELSKNRLFKLLGGNLNNIINNKQELTNFISNFIKYIYSSLPKPKKLKLSHIEKIKIENLNKENEKLNKINKLLKNFNSNINNNDNNNNNLELDLNSIDFSNINSNFNSEIDYNIEEVLQSTLLGELDIPHDHDNDDEDDEDNDLPNDGLNGDGEYIDDYDQFDEIEYDNNDDVDEVEDEDEDDDEEDGEDDNNTVGVNTEGDNENNSVKSTIDEGNSHSLRHDTTQGINSMNIESEVNSSKKTRGTSSKSKSRRSGSDNSKTSTKDRRHHGNDGDSTGSKNTKSSKVKNNNQLKKSTDLLSLFNSKKNKKTLEKLIEHLKNCNYVDNYDDDDENSKIDVNLLTNIFKLVSAIDNYELKLMNGIEGLDISNNINRESISVSASVDNTSKQ